MSARMQPLDKLLPQLRPERPITPLRRGGRAAFLSISLFFLMAAFGCSTSVTEDEMDFMLAHPGNDAASIARARAENYENQVRLWERERDGIERRRVGLLKDAAAYRTKAAEAWSDPALADRGRAPRAREYNRLADEREAQAQRCEEVIQSLDASIALFQGRRKNQLQQADKLENMVVPLSGSE